MKKLFTLIMLLFTTKIFATPQYTIVIDAGDTNSRLHLFQYDSSTNIPTIKEIFSEKSEKPLADFATQPNYAGESLKKLLNDSKEKLISLHIDSQSVPISVLGTEKMRTLNTDTQQLIYTNVSDYIKNNYTYTPRQIQSISGKTQGVYAWIDANYLAENFQPETTTHAILNIEQFSTEIAYATHSSHPSEDETQFTIGNLHYTIFSKSFSTLGEESSRLEADKFQTAQTCYPIDYPFSPTTKGNFNISSCKNNYANVIAKFNLISELPPFKEQKFLLFSNTYRIYDFLGAADPDQYVFEARLYYACGLSWEAMKNEYDFFSESELSSICANSIFIDQLIYAELKLHGEQLWVTDKINRQEIDWPMGEVLYSLSSFR